MDLTDFSLWRDPQIIYHIEQLKSQPHLLKVSDYYPRVERLLGDQELQACSQSQQAQEIGGGVQSLLEQQEDQIWNKSQTYS